MGAVDILKDLLGFAKKLGNLELNQKLIELQESVLALQQHLQQLRQETMMGMAPPIRENSSPS